MIEVRDLRKVFTQNVGKTSIWRKLVGRPETTELVAKVVERTPSEMRAAAGDNRVVEMEIAANGERGISALNEHPVVERVLSVRDEANTSYVRLRTREPLRSVGQLST